MDSLNKHASPPVFDKREGRYYDTVLQSGKMAAKVWGDTEKDTEKLAKLIVAAPHMLSKCEEIYHDIKLTGDETIHDLKTMLEAARAKALSAITKATNAH